MRVAKTPAPLRVYLCALPLIAGALLGGAEQWPYAIALLAIGALWLVLGFAWFARRVSKIHEDEALTTRDVIEIDYPPWMRRLASSYLFLLAGAVGLAIVGAVLFVIVAAISR